MTAAFTNKKSKGTKPDDADNSDDSAPPGKSKKLRKPADGAPKTGDETNLTLWLALLGISGVGMTTMLVISRRKNKGNDIKDH